MLRTSLPQALFRRGWRRTGAINVTLTYTYVLVLSICLFISISRPRSSFYIATILFEGDCTKTTRINLVLHLVLNILSTAVLASSNFFMQVLSSPSRQEIDQAHMWLRSVDIGISSVGNLRHISPSKFIGYLILFISSVPIHLFFNSTIFETTFDGSSWHLTIATEGFTRNATFFPPGASLSPAGAPVPLASYDSTLDVYEWPYYADGGLGSQPGYGESVPFQDYWDNSSRVVHNISSTATAARSWTSLDAVDCQNEYKSCNPRKSYGDVVVVVQGSANNPAGWTRSEMFHFDPASNLSLQWDKHIPPEGINSLWYSTQCTTTRELRAAWLAETCTNTCLLALGWVNTSYYYYKNDQSPPVQENWSFAFNPFPKNLTSEERALGYNDEFDKLKVLYCLAEPAGQCKVGLSNMLLLVVIVCILFKAAVCSIIILKLPVSSLVTLGDAMQSLIQTPDLITEGLGTLDINDSQQLEFGKRRKWTPGDDSELTPIIRPRQWSRKTRRLMSIVPMNIWILTYTLFFIAMIVLSVALGCAADSSERNFSSSAFGQTGDFITLIAGDDPGYMSALLFANMPQILLSLCYFSYNALLTRFSIEKEWSLFSLSYRPLRVSYPTGEQVTSYRLQLPYKYSIPLIGLSILLHWLLSNAIYLFIFEGGYFIPENHSIQKSNHRFQVSDDSQVALGYSSTALLILFVISSAALSLPILIGFRKLKGHMVAGASNSLVLSAACHIPSQATIQRNIDDAGEVETHPTSEDVESVCSKTLREIAERKVRWGVTPMMADLTKAISIEDGQDVQHLSFGGEEHDIREPEDGHYYV